MSEKLTDRRVRKTKKAIHEALLALLEEKDFSDITIIELTQKADVNRKTFYNHYSDLEQVMDEIEEEMAEELINLASEDFTGLGPKLLEDQNVYESFQEKTLEFFHTMIQAFQSHPIYIRLICNPEFENDFLHKVVQKGTAFLMELFGRNIENTLFLNYLLQFIMSGSMSIIKLWAKQGYPVSSEELAEFFDTMFQGSTLKYIQAMAGLSLSDS